MLSFTCGMVAARCKETEALIKNISGQMNGEECFSTLPGSISQCRQEDNNFHLEIARISGSFLRLQSLYFTGLLTSEADVVLLAEAVKVNSTQTEFNLSYNDIGGQCATGLAETLKVNSTLTVLDLSGSTIGDQGATGLDLVR